ncbi:hypothetical protein JDW21_18785 [Bacillus subtilis]|uniref:hypothetical protein n=1 Tax=Bacillus subtilis group TaxID=653685 RepID=UPI002ED4BCF1
MNVTIDKLSENELFNLIGKSIVLTEDHTNIEGNKVLKREGEIGTIVDFQIFWSELTVKFGKRNYKISMSIAKVVENK